MTDQKIPTQRVSTAPQKSNTMKWLSRIGHFLMYGGWMLLLVIVVGIIIAASTCGK